jgi:cysteine synthase
MPKPFENILETVGNTPIVKINKLGPDHVDLYVKLEAFNPLGSIKDRLALGIIETAEKDGSLKPGQTVVEATSGNTGIGLAMVCAQKGYPLVVTMAENFSVERRRLMRFLGAKVILTPAAEKGTGMLAKATELSKKHGWFLTRQFENEANADIHSKTTALEILRDFESAKLDYWVTGFGTGGTLKGVARVLRKERPETKIIVTEPENSVMLANDIKQEYTKDGSPSVSHPNFRPHLMQGWSPDFVAKLANDAVSDHLIDNFVFVNGLESLRLSRELALKEGIFCGISGGATFQGALKIAETAAKGSTILCMIPDTGERYLSTPLFEDIATDMTKDEIAISNSTEGFRFSAPSKAAPKKIAPAVKAKASVLELVKNLVNNQKKPVVMFALEWCEFCWSVRKMFAELQIPFQSIDLDSVEYQKKDLGGDVRTALLETIKSPTIPQVFIGGVYVGGATETFDAFNEGQLQELLKKNQVDFNKDKKIDAYSFLPKWLQPR